MIAGILAPDSGQIVFGDSGEPAQTPIHAATADTNTLDYRGHKVESAYPSLAIDITRLSEAKRDIFRGSHIGLRLPNASPSPRFHRPGINVLLGMSFTGRAHDPAWAKHLLQEVGLAERLHYKPEKLSVGQQQRVAVARALANRPKLVLADETHRARSTRKRTACAGI